MANMLDAPPQAMPASIVAGDSLKVIRPDIAADYPSSGGYALAFVFVPIAGGSPETFAASTSGGSWLLNVPASTTASWSAGSWRWVARVTKDADALIVDSGIVTILANPAAADLDSRSHARRVLDAIEAVIENRATKSDLETTFADGRQIKRMSHTELVQMRSYYAKQVANEDRRAGRGGPRRVLMSL
ncbi:MAG: hypothetical protein V4461_11090 [Pseudomonadota bacterium]